MSHQAAPCPGELFCMPKAIPRCTCSNLRAGLFPCKPQTCKGWMKPSTLNIGSCIGSLPYTSLVGYGAVVLWICQNTSQGLRAEVWEVAAWRTGEERVRKAQCLPILLAPQRKHSHISPPGTPTASLGLAQAHILDFAKALCPLPGEGTRVPTGVLLLPVHPGDRVVAVCVLVVAILDRVGRAGAVCRGSRGQLGLLAVHEPVCGAE